MFKKIFTTVISLIFRPSIAWKELSEKRSEDNEPFLSNYVYPFVGFVAMAAFIGILFSRKEFETQIALKSAILAAMTVFGGFFLSSYLINEVWHSVFHRERNMKLCQCFVGYSSSLMFSLSIVLNLIPEFFFLRFLLLYTIYIVWEGAIPFMEVQEEEQLKFVSISTAIIILTPIIIEFALKLLMPGLSF